MAEDNNRDSFDEFLNRAEEDYEAEQEDDDILKDVEDEAEEESEEAASPEENSSEDAAKPADDGFNEDAQTEAADEVKDEFRKGELEASNDRYKIIVSATKEDECTFHSVETFDIIGTSPIFNPTFSHLTFFKKVTTDYQPFMSRFWPKPQCRTQRSETLCLSLRYELHLPDTIQPRDRRV